jgi:hypothetical protein
MDFLIQQCYKYYFHLRGEKFSKIEYGRDSFVSEICINYVTCQAVYMVGRQLREIENTCYRASDGNIISPKILTENVKESG